MYTMDITSKKQGLPLAWLVKNLQCGRPGFDPCLERSPGEENGSSLQYSCLENLHERRSLVATA